MAIAVMLAEMPPLLRDVLTASLADEPAINVVGDIVVTDIAAVPLGARIERLRPDVLVVGLNRGASPYVCAATLSRFPRMKVFALEEMGRRIALYELRPVRTEIGTASPTALVDAIRRVLEPMTLDGDDRAPAPADAPPPPVVHLLRVGDEAIS